MQNNQRLLQINSWLTHHLKTNDFHLQAMPGDASFRHYFRVRSGHQSYILMDSPPEKEPVSSFITIADIFRQHQICTPEIIIQDSLNGLLLLTDFGDVLLSQQVNINNVKVFYQKAIHIIKKLHTIDISHYKIFPKFDENLVERDLGLFLEWFLHRYLTISLNNKNQKMLSDLFARLIINFVEQPQVCVHRDFHAGNLMVLSKNRLGVIDFQDAVIGPLTYDIVSLLKDSRIHWQKATIDSLLQAFNHEISANLHVSYTQLEHWFDLTGLQLHLKILGIFSRLHFRDGKSGYLKYIPIILQNIMDVTEKYDFLGDFHQFLVYAVQPSIEAIPQ